MEDKNQKRLRIFATVILFILLLSTCCLVTGIKIDTGVVNFSNSYEYHQVGPRITPGPGYDQKLDFALQFPALIPFPGVFWLGYDQNRKVDVGFQVYGAIYCSTLIQRCRNNP